MSVAGTFIPGGAGRILVVTHEPDRPTRRAVLVVPAFGEEMNKSRRLVWETGKVLSEHGVLTIVPDLFGTGDSEGDFAEARWETWIDDLCCVVEWARAREIERFGGLLVRLGAALFKGAAEQMSEVFDRAVAWQPVYQGGDVLKQLLRMKIMAVRMSGGHSAPIEVLQQSLLTGPDPMELGGYMVAAELAAAIQQAAFSADHDASVETGLVVEFSPGGSMERDGDLAREQSERGSWQFRQIVAERFWTAIEPQPSQRLVSTTAEFLVLDR